MSQHLDFRVKDGEVREVWCGRTWVRVNVWTWEMKPLPKFYPGLLRFTCSRCGTEISERVAA